MRESSTAKVCEALSLFGVRAALQSRAALHWKGLKEKYYAEIDLKHWVDTGKHLPLPRLPRLLRGSEYGLNSEQAKRPVRAARVKLSATQVRKLLDI